MIIFKKAKKFKVVNGNEVVQAEFKTLKEAQVFAETTGFKVSE